MSLIFRHGRNLIQFTQTNRVIPSPLFIIVITEENIALAPFCPMIDINCYIAFLISCAVNRQITDAVQCINTYTPFIIFSETLPPIYSFREIGLACPGEFCTEIRFILRFFRGYADGASHRTRHKNTNPIHTDIRTAENFHLIKIIGRHGHLVAHAGHAVHDPAAASGRVATDSYICIQRPVSDCHRRRQRQGIHQTALRLGKRFYSLFGKSRLLERNIEHILFTQSPHLLFRPDQTRCYRRRLRIVRIIAFPDDIDFIHLPDSGSVHSSAHGCG